MRWETCTNVNEHDGFHTADKAFGALLELLESETRTFATSEFQVNSSSFCSIEQGKSEASEESACLPRPTPRCTVTFLQGRRRLEEAGARRGAPGAPPITPESCSRCALRSPFELSRRHFSLPDPNVFRPQRLSLSSTFYTRVCGVWKLPLNLAGSHQPRQCLG